MHHPKNVGILFVAGFGPIVADRRASRALYADALGIPFKEEKDGYLHTESLEGAKTFALWSLSQAAQACFGTESWPAEIPAPQAWLEFDVKNVEEATVILEQQGYRMIVKNRKEPWGQVVSRFLSPEGLLVGVAFTPFFRKKQRDVLLIVSDALRSTSLRIAEFGALSHRCIVDRSWPAICGARRTSEQSRQRAGKKAGPAPSWRRGRRRLLRS
jgi:hypothetical protein